MLLAGPSSLVLVGTSTSSSPTLRYLKGSSEEVLFSHGRGPDCCGVLRNHLSPSHFGRTRQALVRSLPAKALLQGGLSHQWHVQLKVISS